MAPLSPFSRPTLPSSPPSSGSLKGMEMAVPPPSQRSSVSPFVPSYDSSPRHSTRPQTPLPSPGRSPFTPSSDKPLPLLPKRSSSIYSQDEESNRYTRIIESYGEREPEAPPVPEYFPGYIQPTARRSTRAPVLDHHHHYHAPSPRSLTPASEFTSPRKTFSSSPASSAWSTESYPESNKAPSFKEFSQRLQKRKLKKAVSPPPPLPYAGPPVFRAVSYESTRGHDGPPPRLYSPYSNESLIPLPLSLRKSPSPLLDGLSDPVATHRQGHSELTAYLDHGHQKSPSRFSDSSNEARGRRSGAMSYARRKILRDRGSALRALESEEKRERNRVMSIASNKYPSMLNAKELDRRRSGSRPNSGNIVRRISVSIPKRVSSIYDRVQRLSLSPTDSSRSREAKPRRSRQKQPAIPPSPYQLYGTAAWDLEEQKAAESNFKRDSSRRARRSDRYSRKKSRSHSRVTSKKHPSTTSTRAYEDEYEEGDRPKHLSMSEALRNGRSQLIHALGGGGKQTEEERRKEALKRSIKLVGPTHTVSDGHYSYQV